MSPRQRRYRRRRPVRPESVQLDRPRRPAPPTYRLYSTRGVEIATFFGSVIGGAYLVARNHRELGNPDTARNVLLVGLVATFGVLALGYYLPELPPTQDRLLAASMQLGQVLGVSLYSRRVLGQQLHSHETDRGEFYSNWRAAGVGLLAGVLVAGFVLLIVFVTVPTAA